MSVYTDAELVAWMGPCAADPASVYLVTNILYPSILNQISAIFGVALESTEATEFYPAAPIDPGIPRSGIDAVWDRPPQAIFSNSNPQYSGGKIRLLRAPVTAVASIYEYGQAWTDGTAGGNWPASSLIDPTTYRTDQAKSGVSWTADIVRISGSWSNSPRTVKVTYTAGLSDALLAVMPAIKHAVLLTVSHYMAGNKLLREFVKSGGKVRTGRTMKDVSETFGFLGGADGVGGLGGVVAGANAGIPSDALAILSNVLPKNLNIYL